MIIGAHVSTAGGLSKAIERGLAIGVEALQIFPSAPQRWVIKGWADSECADFKAKWPEHFRNIVFHGIYLINLAGTIPQNVHLSKQALIDSLILAGKLGIRDLIFHPGSYQNGELGERQQIKETISKVLEETPVSTRLVYENSSGSVIGGRLEDLAWLIDNSSDKSRVAVCLDSCHAYAAGYDLASNAGYEGFVKEVDRLIGLDKVASWHLNDSKFALASKRDRHANIGEGELGAESFERLVNDSRWGNVAGYLEVPGSGEGPDRANIERLKNLRS